MFRTSRTKTGSREKWRARNVTNKEISIGDLPKVPSMKPGQTLDLLKFYSLGELAESSDLSFLINARWLTLTKTITPSAPIKLNRIEEDELIATIDEKIAEDAPDALYTITNASSNYTILSDDNIILCDASSGLVTVSLPAGVQGKDYSIKKIDSTDNWVKVVPSGNEKIDGESPQIIDFKGDCMKVVSDGSNWNII